VTNGYLTIESIDLLSKYIDAMNIDLKSFSEDFYKKNCKAKLSPVLDTIRVAHKRKIWIEITTLLIEGENTTDDEIRNIAKFISSIDKNIPWHISRFFPMHKMKNIPPTSLDILKKAQIIGKEEGLNYVYIGNTSLNSDTICPKCRKTLISRHAYRTIIEGIDNNSCKYCKTKINGIFS
jgi:pyruvate formate lyase activating enzyme